MMKKNISLLTITLLTLFSFSLSGCSNAKKDQAAAVQTAAQKDQQFQKVQNNPNIPAAAKQAILQNMQHPGSPAH